MSEDLVFGYLLLNGFEISFSHLDEVYFSKKEPEIMGFPICLNLISMIIF